MQTKRLFLKLKNVVKTFDESESGGEKKDAWAILKLKSHNFCKDNNFCWMKVKEKVSCVVVPVHLGWD